MPPAGPDGPSPSRGARPSGDGEPPERPRAPRPPLPPGEPADRREGRPGPNQGVHPDERPTQALNLGLAAEAAGRDDGHGVDEAGYDGRGGDRFDGPEDEPDLYYDDADDYDGDDYDDGDHYDEDGYDDRDDRAAPSYIFGDDGDDPPPTERRRRRRGFRWVAALVVLALLAGGAYIGAREILGFDYDDYEGSGDKDVLLHVEQGDSTGTIAAELAKLDVVASTDAFLTAAEDDQRVLAIQPGYYVVKTRASGASAVETLVGPDAQVGQAEIRAGTRLADRGGDSPQPGVLSQLSEASCAELNGENTCVSVEDMLKQVRSTNLTEFGVPEWAATPAQQRAPENRLEGLIMPGMYDIRPGWDAHKLLTEVLTASATRLESAGLPSAADGTGHSPYEVLTIASIVQVEGVQADFGKIARVIQNRLRDNMPLEMDSSINYALENPTIRTKREARNADGPHNTYTRQGLPATPLGAPSGEAITAAGAPQEGPWKYFVLCEENGLSCFSQSYPEHRKAVRDAQNRGVY